MGPFGPHYSAGADLTLDTAWSPGTQTAMACVLFTIMFCFWAMALLILLLGLVGFVSFVAIHNCLLENKGGASGFTVSPGRSFTPPGFSYLLLSTPNSVFPDWFLSVGQHRWLQRAASCNQREKASLMVRSWQPLGNYSGGGFTLDLWPLSSLIPLLHRSYLLSH